MSEAMTNDELIEDETELDCEEDDECNCERCGHPAFARDQEHDDYETLCPDCIAERQENPWKFEDIAGREHEFD